MKAKYKCTNCGHTWTDKPGWQGTREWACSECKSQYCEWLNYYQLFPDKAPAGGARPSSPKARDDGSIPSEGTK